MIRNLGKITRNNTENIILGYCILCIICMPKITLSYLNPLTTGASPPSGIRQSKVLTWPLLAALLAKGLKKSDLEIELVNPFPTGGSSLTSKTLRRYTG